MCLSLVELLAAAVLFVVLGLLGYFWLRQPVLPEGVYNGELIYCEATGKVFYIERGHRVHVGMINDEKLIKPLPCPAVNQIPLKN